jgi:uncharacterized protein YqgV (UPF0045/DUF77 family)
MITAEVSVYPLKTSDASGVITNSINSLNNEGIEYSVGSISTRLRGSEEQVWNSLKDMFQNAQNSGEISMVITVTNAAG